MTAPEDLGATPQPSTPSSGPPPSPIPAVPPAQPGPPSYPGSYSYPPAYWATPGGVPARPSSAMATASGVLGIVGFAMAVIPAAYWFFYQLNVISAQTYSGVSGVKALLGADFVVATLAIVFGAVHLGRSGGTAGIGRGLARAGLVLGVISLVVAVIFLPLAISAANAADCTAFPGVC